jgi:hypothetical protein
MGRNVERSAAPGAVVATLVPAVAARLANQHPSIESAVVNDVVYQAACELVGVVTVPEQLRCMLDRRANGRLAALAGAPMPITTARDRTPSLDSGDGPPL